MEDENNIEELREKLYKAIENHGRDSPEALEISQELDKLIVEEMRIELNRNKNNWIRFNMKIGKRKDQNIKYFSLCDV